ncbi:uncharacterized protein B0H18DRAFT_1112790 [Fomitopsis serialis]|uniref:uncharacterized protein n=1 Tax=Fomitopsis serialis TaxID=139415 RepID=UPI002007617D|nr:uncharacterized protein B0H18DRAFT_1112790 [Neoantrodia serialis]KAH9938660.1 hypothetical protein B0H18DRAFT_1112790 [Neoantrodia serialis]
MSALARLARTSKIFHSPAIGRLWGTQSGIHNLILCMPVDLFFKLDTLVSVSRMLVPLKYINFRRALQPSDWERFDYYAAHIRELVFPGHEPVLVQVSEAVYTALARYNDHPRPYLTRLRSLAFTSRTEPPALSDMCMALLGPSVEELTVMPGPNDSASAVVALAHASYLSASLARLDIDFRSSPDPSRLLAGALRNLRELRRLSIMSLRPLHIFHDLQRLHVSHVRDLNDGILFEGAAAWPALEELVLTTHPGSGATLRGLTYVAETCQHLRALALDVDVSPEAMQESRWPPMGKASTGVWRMVQDVLPTLYAERKA